MPRNYQNQSPTAHQRRPHLTQDETWIKAFLAKAQSGHIATTENAQPFINTSAFWYDEENRQIVFHSHIVGRVRSNIESNPKVSFEASELGKFLPSNVALEFSLQFRSVLVFGTARVVEEPEEAKRLLYGLIGKYFPQMTAGKEYREITEKELTTTSIYAIKIEAWSGKENWADRADQSAEWTPLDEKWFE